jgi:hypothetical protein
VSQEDIRLYESQEILRILARAQAQRSIQGRFRSGRRLVSQATTPGQRPHRRRRPLASCPTRDRANHLVALLADYSYSSLRYYGKDGVADIQQDAD